MSKLINRRSDLIAEMLDGFLALYPGLSRLAGHNVLVRSDCDEVRDRQVAIISGGGSGHEPAHAGYIGAGMLSAAVAGEIFTSPSVESILAAIRTVTGPLGVLLVVKNYTGDRLNFGLAAEMARAEGFLVDIVLIADDVALARNADHAGRRGLAGTILVHKIAGAAAAAGLDLPQVASLARAAAGEVATMGVALSAGTAASFDQPAFLLEGEVELGLGIHGERGVRRIPRAPADTLVDHLLSEIVSALRLRPAEPLAVLINNLGGTTGIELAIAARKTLAFLNERSFNVSRLYAGTFLSSLDMAGISISLLRTDEDRLKWLDAPTTAPAWPNVLKRSPGALIPRYYSLPSSLEGATPHTPETEAGRKAQLVLHRVCVALIAAEEKLTALDQAVGDGDLGRNMQRAAAALPENLPFDDFPQFLKAIGSRLQAVLGGSSGPLYGVLFLRAGSALESGAQNDPKLWAAAALDGCEAIAELGEARLGDSTMLDALVPFARMLKDRLNDNASLQESLLDALEAARRGAENTAKLVARRGRASYLGSRSVGHRDPGAVAAVIWLEAAVEELLA
ncbi:MAG TPA: dihydroxyacetone kinase subunit DhaL [Bryobacteraceae bacterium]|jgi:dihydroxyacetone kinase